MGYCNLPNIRYFEGGCPKCRRWNIEKRHEPGQPGPERVPETCMFCHSTRIIRRGPDRYECGRCGEIQE